MKGKRFEFRVTESDKKLLKEKAGHYNMSAAELIVKFIRELPIKDKKMRKEAFDTYNNLSKEINYIGHNINQITVMLRLLNGDKKLEDGEFMMLNHQVNKLKQLMNESSSLLREKMLYE